MRHFTNASIVLSCVLLTACGGSGDSSDWGNSSSSPGSSSSSSSSAGDSGTVTIQENTTGFCRVDGTVDSDNEGFTEGGFANTENAEGVAVEYHVNVAGGGNYILELRYAAVSDRPASVLVNGEAIGSISFPTTGAWTSWTTDSANVALDEGDNEISIVATGAEGLPNIDYLAVTGNGAAAVECPGAVSADGPLLPQGGNPVHSRFQNARYEWSSDKADIILSHQYDNGGWPKNQDYDAMGAGGNDLGTFDNGATVTEIVYLAQVYRDTGDTKYRDAVRRAMDYILKAQYPSGGWPQYYPLRGGYSDHATFNDNAMSSILTVLHHASNENLPFDGDIFDDSDREQMQQAINKGVEYILKAQWEQDGTLTVWCAQHGAFDYEPKDARDYELASLSGSESVEVIGFLMTQPQSAEIEAAVKAGLAWFRSPDTYLADHRYEDSVEEKIVESEGDRMWYRFYDLETNEGFFSDRDGGKYYDIMEISAERRNGYSWGGDYGEDIIEYADSVGY